MQTHSNNDYREQYSDEPVGESLLQPWGWFGALIILAVTAAAQVSDIEDRSSERQQYQELKLALDQQQQAERRERAAQSLCTSEYGPNSLAVWVRTNTIECVDKHGRRLSTSTVEAADAQR